MQEYLYVINYPPYEEELCEMEFQSLFHEKMISKYFITNKEIDFYRSAFIRLRITILKTSNHFKELVQYVQNKHFTYYDFKVEYLKNETTHVPYKQTIEYCKQIALPIDGSVNMHHPKVIIILTKIDDLWILGIQNINDQWDKNENKPYTYSSSLSLKLARTLVNIGIENDTHLKVIDPCCGIGTVVLEALSMGVNIKGCDISREVSYQARLNLEHFGYNPLIINKMDMHKIKEQYDVCLLDIPYGLYCKYSEEQQNDIVKSTLHFTKKLVLVSGRKMNKYLESIGYKIINQCQVGKNESMDMIRYVTVCIRGK
jgi:Predicted DNA modification methylase